MALVLESQPLPLTIDPEGAIRISGTRVTLDTVIQAFQEGATAEEIAQQYPALSLPDIYSVIGYYLRQSKKINQYLHRRSKAREKARQQNETRFDPNGLRERLLARRND